jgi:Carboxypeptidase regulatory-like domain
MSTLKACLPTVFRTFPRLPSTFLALSFLTAGLCCAQEAVLFGTITDAAADPLTGVQVTATEASGAVFSTTSDSAGHYNLNLVPGKYTVTAQAAGFKNTLTHADLSLGGIAQLNFVLEIGAISETIVLPDLASPLPLYFPWFFLA